MNIKDTEIKELLTRHKRFVVYGLSPDESKPSQRVPLFMKSKGYAAVGTYPGQTEIAGFKIYSKLADVPLEYRKFVDVFRNSDKIPAVVDEVIAAGGVEVLWLQLGISHPEAEKRAEAAGIKVVSDRCLHIEYEKWMKKA